MSFSVHESLVALCNKERVIIYNVENDTENVVMLPDLEPSLKIGMHNSSIDLEIYHMIRSVIFSEDGRYFAVCVNRKQLFLYETKDMKQLSIRTLARAASKIRFSPNNDIVVADKAGDVYLFSTSSPMENGSLILGHMSVLLDIFVTQDMKYILTTDRDEKIRVSMFPNCYNVVSYCLGHTKFVTNISELPHDKSILISCGGDGNLKLWDYVHGTELLSMNFCDKISKSVIEKFNQVLRDNDHNQSVEVLPVKHMRVSSLDELKSLVVISFYCSKVLLIYNITGNQETQLKADYLESLSIEFEPIECFLHKQDLWVLTDAGVQVYKFQEDKFVAHDTLNCAIKRLNKSWETLKDDTFKLHFYSVLYKRPYDYPLQYFARKKLRCRGKNTL